MVEQRNRAASLGNLLYNMLIFGIAVDYMVGHFVIETHSCAPLRCHIYTARKSDLTYN